MTADLINITSTEIKQHAIELYSSANGCRVTANPDSLEVERLTDDLAMLQNPSTKTGVIFKKINIADIFPVNIDLTPYRGLYCHNRVIEGDDVDSFNKSHEAVLVSREVDVLKARTSYSKRDLANFVLFCRVLGFYELDIGSVTLIDYHGKLRIQVNQGNKLFTGFIEVTV